MPQWRAHVYRFRSYDKRTGLVVKPLPVGTNLALLYLLWALLSGAFLSSRGAVFPALLAVGLSAAQIRRSSQAVRTGAWSSDELVLRWRAWVAAHSSWRPDTYEGYQPLAVDITAFGDPDCKVGWASFSIAWLSGPSRALGSHWWSKLATTAPNACRCSSRSSTPSRIR